MTSVRSGRRRTLLDGILEKGRPEVTVNGSHHSIKNLIDSTDPQKLDRNGSAVNLSQGELPETSIPELYSIIRKTSMSMHPYYTT